MLISIFNHVLIIYFYIPKSPTLYWISICLYFNLISMFQTIYHNKDEAILCYFYFLILCTFSITYLYQSSSRGHHGRDSMVVGLQTTWAISANYH